MRLLLITISIFLITSESHSSFLESSQCNQKISDLSGHRHIHSNLVTQQNWYEVDGTKFKISEVESDVVAFKFWGSSFYGIEIGITGKDKINHVLRYLKAKAEKIYMNDPENSFFSNPITNSDHEYGFVFPSEVVILKRFSVNLGQVEVICRDQYFKFEGIDNPE